jgi:hypothetical protein
MDEMFIVRLCVFFGVAVTLSVVLWIIGFTYELKLAKYSKFLREKKLKQVYADWEHNKYPEWKLIKRK